MPYVLGELIITIGTIIIEIVLWINSGLIPSNSADYPQGLLSLAFILSFSFLLVCIRRIMKHGLQKPKELPEPGSCWQIIILCTMVCAYLLLLNTVGYLLLTPVFVFACLFYLGMRKLQVLIFLPLILTGSTYYLFSSILFIFLPRGFLG